MRNMHSMKKHKSLFIEQDLNNKNGKIIVKISKLQKSVFLFKIPTELWRRL